MTKQTTVNGEFNKDWTKIELDAYDGPEPYILSATRIRIPNRSMRY